MAFLETIDPENEGVQAVMSRFPDQARPLIQLTQQVMRDGECALSSSDRELIAAYVSGVNACTYCTGTHSATAVAFGVDPQLLESAVMDLESSAIDASLKPLLSYARKLTLTPSRVTQADAHTLVAAGWGETEFHFLVMICSLFNFYNRLMDGYGVANQEDFRVNRGRAIAEHGYLPVPS